MEPSVFVHPLPSRKPLFVEVMISLILVRRWLHSAWTESDRLLASIYVHVSVFVKRPIPILVCCLIDVWCSRLNVMIAVHIVFSCCAECLFRMLSYFISQCLRLKSDRLYKFKTFSAVLHDFADRGDVAMGAKLVSRDRKNNAIFVSVEEWRWQSENDRYTDYGKNVYTS